MITNLSLLLLIVTVTSVASQTFQYSRGWTNGKRDGHKREDTLEKILTPCQMHKLKYLLEGKTLTERLLTPCDYLEDEIELSKRNKAGRTSDHSEDRTQESLYDAFQ